MTINPKISIIIPTYNSINTLKNCLSSLYRQSISPFEVIVIDNASTDNTSEIIKTKFPKVRLKTLKENTGVTGGRNNGIKMVSQASEYVMFFDHDMIADKNMLLHLLKVANLSTDIGITTPKIYYYSDKQRIWAAGTDINLWTGQILFRGGQDNGQYESDAEVGVAPAAIFVKSEVLDKIKQFDDIYFGTYEDTEFCFKAKQLGYKTMYAAKAIAYHDLSMDRKQEYKRLLSRAYWVGRNRVIFMKRYGKSLPIFYLFLPVYIVYYLRIAVIENSLKSGINFVKGTIAGLWLH